MLVEIGHGWHEPAFDSLLEVELGAIRVYHGGELVRGLKIG